MIRLIARMERIEMENERVIVVRKTDVRLRCKEEKRTQESRVYGEENIVWGSDIWGGNEPRQLFSFSAGLVRK